MPIISRTTKALTSSCALFAACLATHSMAQPRAQTVPTPGRGVSSVADADAVLVNPANMSALVGSELRWTWVRTKSTSWSSARGHAFSFATSLPFGLGFGLRADLVRPPAGALADDPTVRLAQPYTWLTSGLSFGGTRQALGLQISHLFIDEPGMDGVTTVGVGWTGRPTNWISLGMCARNLNEPRTSRGLKLADRQVTMGATWRPTSTRAFELGLEAGYFHGFSGENTRWAGDPWPVRSGWVPKLTAGADIPYVGRVHAEVSTPRLRHQPSYVASATVDINVGHLTATGGATFGSALGGRDGSGWITGLAVRSWSEPGMGEARYALRIRLEHQPGNRGHIALLRKLWKASLDRDMAAVVLQFKSSPASSLAHAYELDDAVKLLRARGKPVVCQLEDAGLRAEVACAHATRILVHPAGGLRFAGLALRHLYLGQALRRLGVRTQFVRIGAHKSAPEQLTYVGGSPVARRDTQQNLSAIDEAVIGLLADGRRQSAGKVRETIARGPFTAREALRYHLVDGYAYDDEVEGLLGRVIGAHVTLRDHMPTRAPTDWGRGKRLAIVLLDGNIIDGRSGAIPLIGTELAGSYTMAQALRRARQDSSIAAVVFRIESPGGSSVASDVIWREVALTAKSKPVIVSMGGVAASGGYYAAAGANKILATPFTVTGSIGIFYGKADVQGLLTHLGIGVETTKTASKADAESVFRPFSPAEVKELGAKVKQFYDVFIDRVSRGRHMTPEQVDRVARGRVWMGGQAKKIGLVDQVGGLRQAIKMANALVGLGERAPITIMPPPRFSLLRLAQQMAGGKAGAQTSLPSTIARGQTTKQIQGLVRAATPFIVYSANQSLALSEVVQAP